MKKFPVLASSVLLALAVPAVAGAQHSQSMKMSYHVMLSGKAEVTKKGPAKAHGTATVTIDMSKHKLCYSVTVMGVDLPAIAAHIHAAKAGVEGNVVVPFSTSPGKNGRSVGCVSHVSSSLLSAIEKHPSNYYVNIHTKKYSNGAVRGQL